MIMGFNDVADAKKAFSHILLTDGDIARAVADHPNWKDGIEEKNGFVNVQTFFNGIECPPEVLERLIGQWYDMMYKQFEKKYEDVEREIQTRVNQKVSQIVSEKVDPYFERLNKMTTELEHVTYMSASEWEKT